MERKSPIRDFDGVLLGFGTGAFLQGVNGKPEPPLDNRQLEGAGFLWYPPEYEGFRRDFHLVLLRDSSDTIVMNSLTRISQSRV